jgi:hypothetical protein
MIVSASVYILNIKDTQRADEFRVENDKRESERKHDRKGPENNIEIPIVFEKTAKISCKAAMNHPSEV